MGNATKDPNPEDMVNFIIRCTRDERDRLHIWAKKNKRSANKQIIHVVDENEPPVTN